MKIPFVHLKILPNLHFFLSHILIVFLYVLNTNLTQGSASLAVRKSAFATRANLTLRVNYQLSPISGGETVLSGNETIIVSYNILDSDFATLMAEKDARARAVRELALAIRTHLAAHLTVGTPKKNSKKKEQSRR